MRWNFWVLGKLGTIKRKSKIGKRLSNAYKPLLTVQLIFICIGSLNVTGNTVIGKICGRKRVFKIFAQFIRQFNPRKIILLIENDTKTNSSLFFHASFISCLFWDIKIPVKHRVISHHAAKIKYNINYVCIYLYIYSFSARSIILQPWISV